VPLIVPTVASPQPFSPDGHESTLDVERKTSVLPSCTPLTFFKNQKNSNRINTMKRIELALPSIRMRQHLV